MFSAAVINRYTTLHTWTGITTGVLLFVAFYAGSLSLFEDELDAWANPAAQQQHQMIQAGIGHSAEQIFNAFLTQVEPKQDFFLFFGDKHQLPWVTWIEGGNEEKRQRYYLYEPNTQPQIRKGSNQSAAAPFIEQLHYTMGLPRQLGRYFFGLITLIYGIALVSGIIIHLPEIKKNLFSIRSGKNVKKFWKDSHNVIGVFSLPFHLMYVVTSLLLTVSIVSLVGTNTFTLGNAIPPDKGGQIFEIAPKSTAQKTQETDKNSVAMLPLNQLMIKIKLAAPELELAGISFANYAQANANVQVSGYYPRSIIGAGRIQLSAITGETQGVDLPGRHNPFLALGRITRSLHYAQFGENGMAVLIRFIYFVLGLLGAFLFYSGNLLWLETRRKRRSGKQAKHHYLIAKLTVAGCLGSALGISVILLVAKVLPTDIAGRGNIETLSWYITLALATLWCLYRPVRRGAVDLLILCAVVTLILPIANAIFYLPLWQSAGYSWPMFGVDIGAILLGLGFAAMARATAKRVAPENSVWQY